MAVYTTKIHLAVDSYGFRVHFELSGGQVHDIAYAKQLICRAPKSEYVIADQGYDSEKLRDSIKEQGAIPVIPRRKNNKTGNDDMDWCLYKYRHLVENAFARIEHFPAIATIHKLLCQNQVKPVVKFRRKADLIRYQRSVPGDRV